MDIESRDTICRNFGYACLAGLLIAASGVSSSRAQVPEVFRPNAGSLLNIYAPPARMPSLPAATVPEVAGQMPEDDDAAGVRFRLARVILDGVTLLPQAEVEAQLAGLIGKEVSLAELREAAARVTRQYRDSGYFLARAYLPAQEISDGIVHIAVIEGRYDGVTVTGSARLVDARVRQLFEAQGVTAGQPVERARLERSLILLEHWADAPAQALLRPGASHGTSHMAVATPTGPLFGGVLGADNYGAYFSGQARATASLTVNSPLGLGDRGSVWLAHSSGTDAVFATYQIPVAYDGLTVGASVSHYRYALCCEFSALERTGSAAVAGLQARYPLRLRRSEVMFAGLSLEHKRLRDRWTGGVLGDKRADVVSVSLDGLRLAMAGQVRYRLALSVGRLDLRGPASAILSDAATVDTAGRYAKAWGQIEFLQPLAGRQFINVRLSGQLASRNLDAAEKFLLGGFNGIRAYPEGEAAGDEAWLARIDWVMPLSLNGLTGETALRAFIDGGAVRVNDTTRGGLANPGIPNHYSLFGAGLGVSWALPQGWTFSALVARKLGTNPARSASGEDADGQDSRVRGWLSAEWRL